VSYRDWFTEGDEPMEAADALREIAAEATGRLAEKAAFAARCADWQAAVAQQWGEELSAADGARAAEEASELASDMLWTATTLKEAADAEAAAAAAAAEAATETEAAVSDVAAVAEAAAVEAAAAARAEAAVSSDAAVARTVAAEAAAAARAEAAASRAASVSRAAAASEAQASDTVKAAKGGADGAQPGPDEVAALAHLLAHMDFESIGTARLGPVPSLAWANSRPHGMHLLADRMATTIEDLKGLMRALAAARA